MHRASMLYVLILFFNLQYSGPDTQGEMELLEGTHRSDLEKIPEEHQSVYITYIPRNFSQFLARNSISQPAHFAC